MMTEHYTVCVYTAVCAYVCMEESQKEILILKNYFAMF